LDAPAFEYPDLVYGDPLDLVVQGEFLSARFWAAGY
jgi:hypothetical protein